MRKAAETETSGVLRADYAAKDPGYFQNAREDYVRRLPADPAARILELGCGNGATGVLALRRGKAGAYVGVEMFTPMRRSRTQRRAHGA